MSETQEVVQAQQMNNSLWKTTSVQSTCQRCACVQYTRVRCTRVRCTCVQSMPLSITRLQKNSLKTILWLFLGLLNYASLVSCELEFFNVALNKRPTTWPQDATCGTKSSSVFCENTPSSSTEDTCVNRSICDLACPSTFYRFAALARPEIVLNLFDDSLSSGWSKCVAKDFSFLSPSASAGEFSVRFQTPLASTNSNCSLVVDQSWLAPIIISDMWNITFSMWIYSQMQGDSAGTLVEIASSSNPLLRIDLESARIKIQSGSVLLQEPSWQIPLNQWNHLAFVVYDEFINIFLNGQFLPPGVFQLNLSPRNIANKCHLGQSISGQTQFVGYMQNVQIYFGALSNREMQYIYNQLPMDGDHMIQLNCTCPSMFPALVANDSGLCQQNPGNLSLPDRVPRLNHFAHPIDFITDDDLNTFWISEVNSSSVETNSIAIDFGSVHQVRSVHLLFYSPLPLVTTILVKRSPLSSWEPLQSISIDCSDPAINTASGVPCQKITGHQLLSGSLTFDLVGEEPVDEDQLHSITLTSTINISLTGFPAKHPLYRYHALYNVVVNATCYCYGNDSVCDPHLQSCICGDASMTNGLNCETCVTGSYLNSSADDHVCHPCDCDLRGTINASNSCDMDGGQCQCKPNVIGRRCDTCANGYYNLTSSNVDGCQMCRCHVNNTVSCDVNTGACTCAKNVEGSTCDRCRQETFWSQSGPGCDACDCFAPGTINRSASCDVDGGQCSCKRNVGTRTCGRCKPGFYDIQDGSVEGCVPCNCSALGTVDGATCDDVTGQCSCRPTEGDVALGGRRCESYFSSIYPDFGPESGGTVVSMSVGYVRDVRGLIVSIGSLFPCLIDYNSSAAVQVVCVTVPLSNMSELLNQSLPVTIQLPNGQILTAVDRFTYYPDPIIERVWPLRTIESGGINLTVVGLSLRSVAMPRLRVMMVQTKEQASQTVTVFTSPCIHVEATLICPTPRLILPKREQTLRKRDVMPGTVNRTLPDPKNDSRDDLRFYIGFIFDGVDKYLNLSETLPRYGLLNVYENPTIYDFSEPNRIKKLQLCQPYNDSTLVIKGYNLDLGAGFDDYTVTVGHELCHIIQLSSNEIVCLPPDHQPEPEDEIFSRNGFPAVKVKVGNIQNSPGYLEYDKSCGSDTIMKYSLIASTLTALIIIVIVVIVCVLVKRRRRRPLKHFNHLTASTEEIYRPTNLYLQSKKKTLKSRSMYLTPLNSTLEAFLCKLPDDLRLKVEDCLLEGQDLTPTRMIGQGNFGQVFVGELTGNENTPMQVAVKMLRENQFESRPQEVIDFLDEATLMHQLNHEHILSLIGIILKPGGSSKTSICIVLPYMDNGDLRSFVSNEANVLTVKALLEFGLQVADGMKYLESNKFIHRDLACRNCMVSGDMVVKVADFGLSKDIYERDYYRVTYSRRPLPVKWMAIESLEAGIFSTKSDVWSYGVLLWELLTRGSTPYPDIDHMDVKAHLKLGKRLTKPDYAPDEIYSLMMECWKDIPETRPTFHDIECRISCFLKISESPSNTNSESPLQESNSSDVAQVHGRTHENYVEMSESELLPNGDMCSQMEKNVGETNEECSVTCNDAPHSGVNSQMKCNGINELTKCDDLCKNNSVTVLDFAPTDHSLTPYDNFVLDIVPADHSLTPYDNLVGDDAFDYTRL